MGGHRDERVDTEDWPPKNELEFLQIVYEKVKVIGDYKFKKQLWDEISEELLRKTSVSYGAEKLKAKLNRLCQLYREFTELICHTRVTWSVESNVVNAPEDVWQNFKGRGKNFAKFRKRGCDNYELFGYIFEKTTATGQLQYSSSQAPLDSDGERRLEDEVLAADIHHKAQTKNIISDEEDKLFSQIDTAKRAQSNATTRNLRKRKYRRTSNEFEAALLQLTINMNSRIEIANRKQAAKMERYNTVNNVATSAHVLVNDYGSVEVCIEILENIEDVSSATYIAATEKFKEPYYRNLFVKMSDVRRKQWLDALLV